MTWGVPELVSLAALLVVLCADIAFIIFMHACVAWRSNLWGRHVMAFSYVLAGSLLVGLARLAVGDYPGRRWTLMTFYCLLAAVTVQRLWLAVREHRRGRPRHLIPPPREGGRHGT